jgi:hypothetical protein
MVPGYLIVPYVDMIMCPFLRFLVVDVSTRHANKIENRAVEIKREEIKTLKQNG